MWRDVAVALFVVGRFDDACPRVVGDSVARQIAIRPGHAITANCHEHDFGVDGLQVFVAKAATGKRAWSHGFDDNVGIGGEFLKGLDAFFGPEVEHDGPLASVAVEEEQRCVFDDRPCHLTAVVAPRGFDLDDVGAELGEIGSDSGGSEHRSLDDADSFKGSNFSHAYQSVTSSGPSSP